LQKHGEVIKMENESESSKGGKTAIMGDEKDESAEKLLIEA
jgi:hypothetical protein